MRHYRRSQDYTACGACSARLPSLELHTDRGHLGWMRRGHSSTGLVLLHPRRIGICRLDLPVIIIISPGWSVVPVAVVVVPAVAATIAAAAFAAFPASLATVSKSCRLGWHSSFVHPLPPLAPKSTSLPEPTEIDQRHSHAQKRFATITQ